MAVIQQNRLVPYTPKQMFDLVDDIDSYPLYLPWCAQTTIHRREADQVEASITMSKGPMSHSFTTLNHNTPHQQIHVQLVRGPFSHLQGAWKFNPQDGQGCLIDFHLEFEFAGRMLKMLAEPVFKTFTERMVAAFCQRAEQIYGVPGD